MSPMNFSGSILAVSGVNGNSTRMSIPLSSNSFLFSSLVESPGIVFPEKKLAIFCDGKEFHDAEKDRRIVKELEQLGIQSLRFSGKQITENLEAVLNSIERQY